MRQSAVLETETGREVEARNARAGSGPRAAASASQALLCLSRSFLQKARRCSFRSSKEANDREAGTSAYFGLSDHRDRAWLTSGIGRN